MLFAIVSVDKPNALELRHQTRPAHREYVKTIQDRISDAGAVLAPNGEVAATVLILEADSLEQAERMAADDPYAKVDLFLSRTVGPFRMSHRNGQKTG